MKAWIALLLAGLALVTASFLPGSSTAPKPAVSETAPAEEMVDRGMALFMAKGCATCHRHDGAQGPTGTVATGPDLTHYQPDPEFVRRWLSDPTTIRPNTMMPDLKLNEMEIEALIAFLAAGEDSVSAGKRQAQIGDVPSAGCPVTASTTEHFVPPEPYPAESPYEDQFWYGSASLWTLLPSQGSWNELPRGETGYVQKVVWFREGYNWQEEPNPELTVTGRRLDGPKQSFKESEATNGYHPDLGSFMLTGIEIPDYGCWQITGEYAGQTLSFVVRVGA